MDSNENNYPVSELRRLSSTRRRSSDSYSTLDCYFPKLETDGNPSPALINNDLVRSYSSGNIIELQAKQKIILSFSSGQNRNEFVNWITNACVALTKQPLPWIRLPIAYKKKKNFQNSDLTIMKYVINPNKLEKIKFLILPEDMNRPTLKAWPIPFNHEHCFWPNIEIRRKLENPSPFFPNLNNRNQLLEGLKYSTIGSFEHPSLPQDHMSLLGANRTKDYENTDLIVVSQNLSRSEEGILLALLDTTSSRFVTVLWLIETISQWKLQDSFSFEPIIIRSARLSSEKKKRKRFVTSSTNKKIKSEDCFFSVDPTNIYDFSDNDEVIQKDDEDNEKENEKDNDKLNDRENEKLNNKENDKENEKEINKENDEINNKENMTSEIDDWIFTQVNNSKEKDSSLSKESHGSSLLLKRKLTRKKSILN